MHRKLMVLSVLFFAGALLIGFAFVNADEKKDAASPEAKKADAKMSVLLKEVRHGDADKLRGIHEKHREKGIYKDVNDTKKCDDCHSGKLFEKDKKKCNECHHSKDMAKEKKCEDCHMPQVAMLAGKGRTRLESFPRKCTQNCSKCHTELIKGEREGVLKNCKKCHEKDNPAEKVGVWQMECRELQTKAEANYEKCRRYADSPDYKDFAEKNAEKALELQKKLDEASGILRFVIQRDHSYGAHNYDMSKLLLKDINSGFESFVKELNGKVKPVEEKK